MPAPVFVLGAPRSGTTLLRVMIAGHPQLFSPPEMVIAPFATMAERRKRLDERFWEKGGLRRAVMELLNVGVDEAKAIEASLDDRSVPEVYAWMQEKLGDRILVDKCPHLAADPAALARLGSWYPDARWIWIIRHPGSVTRSIENMPMAEVILQGYAPDARAIWYHANRTIQRFLAGVPKERQVFLRYEDLVTNPEPSMRAVCTMLGLPFEPAMCDPYEGDRMREGPPGARAVGDPNMAGRGKLQPELATSWLEGFDPSTVSPETHLLARELGYDLSTLAAPPMTRVSQGLDDLFATAKELVTQHRMPADLDAVEGHRFLLRMLAAGNDLFIEHNDADYPQFHHAEGPTRKMFADCPDADYLRAPIRLGGGRVYVVTGAVPPGTTYVGILLYGKGGRPAARMPDRDFVRPDGTFEVRISVAPQEGSWLKAEGDETAVFVRQYYHDRRAQPHLTIDIRLEGPPPTPTALDPAQLARGLDLSRRNLQAVFKRTIEAWKMASVAALNRFIPIGGEQLFPTPDNTYLVCWYRMGQDQLMIIRGTMPAARYVSFCLYNAWMESLDYHRHTICLNDREIITDSEGNYEIVLSHRDVGAPNRLDPAGHLAGYLLIRCLLADGAIPVPSVEVRYEREWPGTVTAS